VLAAQPGLVAASLFLGASYLKLGEPARAIAPLEKVVAASPDRNAELMLAEALLGAARYKDALPRFQESARSLPSNPRVWYGIGQTSDALAEAARQEMETSFPRSAYTLLATADSLRTQRRFGRAFETYRQALSAKPALPAVHAGLAQLYRETGHSGWAEQEEAAARLPFSDSPAVSPDAATYSSYRAYVDLASDAYSRLAQFPLSLENKLHQAKVLAAQGRFREAALQWRAALDEEPANDEIRQVYARSLYSAQDDQATLPILEDLLIRHPDSPDLNFLAGACYVHLEKPQQALPFLEKALQQAPGMHAAHAALGQAMLHLGKPQQAIPHLQLAAAGLAEANVQFQLFRAYQLTGQQVLANRAFAAFQQLRKSADEQSRADDGATIVGPAQ